MQHRIVIELYPHTPLDEVADILADLRRIGIDDAKYESDDSSFTEAIRSRLARDYNA